MRGIDIDADLDLSGHLFPHQRDVTSFLLKAGRCAAFLFSLLEI